ncbi:MAG: hypothetical protein ACYCWE_03375 [Eubacteriales bacterium]
MNDKLITDYMKLLNRWVEASIQYLITPPDRPDLRYYGDGSNGWGVQTNQKAFAAFAVVSVMPDGKPEMLDAALSMLRYSFESHKSGQYHVTDGDDIRWGHTWISALGIERMMHGVQAIRQYFNPSDEMMLKNMLVSESDWLLENHPVTADPIKNVPESNMWNGAVLYRTAVMYPDTPNAARYIEKGLSFMLNAISVPSEKYSSEYFAGKPMSEWFIGGNFFETYALNHHGYLNEGYIVITMSNAAMLHFTLRELGINPPTALYHNLEKVWQLVRAAMFDDGRLLRWGGDTRVRYCYCQDYLLPSLALVSDALGEDTVSLESGWIDVLNKEVAYNDDGSFLSKRCELFCEKSLLYYTRLESDRAAALSFNAYYHYLYNSFDTPAGCGDYAPNPSYKKNLDAWYDSYHGSCFVKNSNRFASFTWRSAELPQGMCVPLDDSSLAEWKNNMTSWVTGDGSTDYNSVLEHHEKLFEGGFITSGRYITTTDGLLAEQASSEKTIINHIAFAALPDSATVVTMQYASAIKPVSLNSVKGLNLNIPNDVFNDFKRDYAIDSSGRYICVDNHLGVISVYGDPLTIHKFGYRQIGLKKTIYKERGMLHCDEICTTLQLKPHRYHKGECVFDFCAAVVAGADITATAAAKTETVDTCVEFCRAVIVTGQDGIRYLIAANFGEKQSTFCINGKEITINADFAEVISL